MPKFSPRCSSLLSFNTQGGQLMRLSSGIHLIAAHWRPLGFQSLFLLTTTATYPFTLNPSLPGLQPAPGLHFVSAPTPLNNNSATHPTLHYYPSSHLILHLTFITILYTFYINFLSTIYYIIILSHILSIYIYII